MMSYMRMKSPVGELILVGEVEAGTLVLTGIHFAGGSHAEAPISEAAREDASVFTEVIEQLEAYFDGKRTTFDLTLSPRGTTFQRAVWHALSKIPYGTTTTYASVARSIGMPKAVRAVGAANGRNPLPIVVPCHRVIGQDGTLTGYGGGLANKRTLLALEARRAHGKSV